LWLVETHQVEINQNEKEAELENDIPSIQVENIANLQNEKPLPEIDPTDTEKIITK